MFFPDCKESRDFSGKSRANEFVRRREEEKGESLTCPRRRQIDAPRVSEASLETFQNQYAVFLVPQGSPFLRLPSSPKAPYFSKIISKELDPLTFYRRKRTFPSANWIAQSRSERKELPDFPSSRFSGNYVFGVT